MVEILSFAPRRIIDLRELALTGGFPFPKRTSLTGSKETGEKGDEKVVENVQVCRAWVGIGFSCRRISACLTASGAGSLPGQRQRVSRSTGAHPPNPYPFTSRVQETMPPGGIFLVRGLN